MENFNTKLMGSKINRVDGRNFIFRQPSIFFKNIEVLYIKSTN